jgi:hypothetical protein
MRRLIIGAIAGLIATLPMTIVILCGRRLHMLRTPPPKQITKAVVKRVGNKANPSLGASEVGWPIAHFGYGAACGAIYSLVRPALPGPQAVKGLLFGGAVWGVSYIGYIPALDLYPWPKDDSRTRTAVMIAAHAVFGVNTAQFERLFSGLNEASDCFVTLQAPESPVTRRT